ncbi:MAG: N-acetylmuramoyl-L-alanine amidase [Clostridia bacterium]|nr:N-acetylmuramoyl-L-alanine amidase [Clostridia bacterium]
MRKTDLFFLRRASMLLLTALCLVIGLRGMSGQGMVATLHPAVEGRPVVLLDAGHGGFDGGAASQDGVLEKDLNLAVAKKLELELLQRGYAVIMTRTKDEALRYKGKSGKSADLNARAALADQYADAVLISIHMNKFEVAKYSGAQVFYSANHPNSRLLAEAVQTSLREQLQPDNHREIKQGGGGIYLLLRAAQPAILVECGFLSNPQETAQLQQPAYQQQLVEAIANGLESYYNKEKDEAGQGTATP